MLFAEVSEFENLLEVVRFNLNSGRTRFGIRFTVICSILDCFRGWKLAMLQSKMTVVIFKGKPPLKSYCTLNVLSAIFLEIC